MFRRRFQPLGLCGQVTGNALVEPAMDVGSEMNDMGRHYGILCKYPGSNQTSRVTPNPGVGNGYSMSR